MASFTDRLKGKGVSSGYLTFTERIEKRRAEDQQEAAKRSKTLQGIRTSEPPTFNKDSLLTSQQQAYKSALAPLGTPTPTPQARLMSKFEAQEAAKQITPQEALSVNLKDLKPAITTRMPEPISMNLGENANTGGYLANRAISGLGSTVEGLETARKLMQPKSEEIPGLPPTQLGLQQERLKEQRLQDRTSTAQAGESKSGATRFIGNMVEAGTGMLPTIALSAASGGVMGIPFIMTSATGNSYEQARREGADHGQALKYGVASGLIEGAIEGIIGGIPGMKGVADPLIDIATRSIKSRLLKEVAKYGLNALGEGIEEALASAIDPLLRRGTFDETAKADLGEILNNFLVGTATSALMQAPTSLAGIRGTKTSQTSDIQTNPIQEAMQNIQQEVETELQRHTSLNAALDENINDIARLHGEQAQQELQTIQDKYNQAIEDVQNEYMTNELRADEAEQARQKYGLDDIVSRMEEAETKLQRTPEQIKSDVRMGLGTQEMYELLEQRRKPVLAQPEQQQVTPIGGDIKQDAQPMLYTGDTQQDTITRPIGEPLPDPVNKVVMDSPKEKSGLQQKWRDFYTKTVDNQDPIVQFSKVANDQTDILASNARNAGGTVDYILTDALVDRQGNKIGKSLKDISESIPQGKETDFWNYMMQRHNIDRAREGNHVIPNYTPEMSMRAVAEIEAANPEFKSVGDGVTNWIDAFMSEWGVNSGIVDAEVYGNLRDTYKSYFPTQREFSEIEKSMPDGVRKQFVDQNSPIKKATGSARDVNNPIENIMSLVNRTVKTAKYNAAGQSFLNSIRNNPNLANIAEIIPAHEGMTANTDNVISVMENGKPVYVRLYDKPLLDALKGIPKTVNNAPLARKLTGAFKNVVTQKNPIFGMVNMMRDIPTAYIYGSESNPLTFAKDYLTSAKDIVTNNENYQRYKALGGEMSSFFKGDVEAAAKRLSKRGVPILNSIEIFNTMIESNPRFSEFNRVLDATGDVEQALYAANNVTVNFARGGNVTKSIEPFVPYLNAGVQGLDKLVRTFKDPKTAWKALIKGGIAVTLPEMALYFINRDREEYKELDNRTKDMYFLIPTGNGKFIKIPKSRELGIVLGSLFQRVFRAVEGESPESAFKGIGTSFLTNIAPANPIENNIFSPMLNLKSNKDFANRNIVPQAMVMDKRSPYLQYDERTTEIAKWIGEFSTKFIEGGLSPKQIDYLIDAYTGVIGDFLQPLTTKGGNILKPITTRFVADPIYSNQTLTDFYDNYDMLQRKATDKNIVEDLPTSGKKNIVTPEEEIRNKFRKASEGISDINKQIKMLEASFEIDKDEKMRELRRQMLNIAREANAMLE